MHENTQPMGDDDDDDPTLPTRNVRRRCRVLSTQMSRTPYLLTYCAYMMRTTAFSHGSKTLHAYVH